MPSSSSLATAPARILVVYAHPDDESFGPAAELARYARAGTAIFGLFATRGECGQTHLEPPPAPEELARLRERDLREAAALIGFADLEIRDYADGSLDRLPPDELQAVILTTIRHRRPEVVITFGPGGITRHPDHVAIHHATTAAFHQARAEGGEAVELYYDAVPPDLAKQFKLTDLPDGQPNTWIDVSTTASIKLAALRIHARHMADARRRVAEHPPTRAPLYRAWPPVPPGMTLSGFCQSLPPE